MATETKQINQDRAAARNRNRASWQKFVVCCNRSKTTVTKVAEALGVGRQRLVNMLLLGDAVTHERARTVKKLVHFPISKWPRLAQTEARQN